MIGPLEIAAQLAGAFDLLRAELAHVLGDKRHFGAACERRDLPSARHLEEVMVDESLHDGAPADQRAMVSKERDSLVAEAKAVRTTSMLTPEWMVFGSF